MQVSGTTPAYNYVPLDSNSKNNEGNSFEEILKNKEESHMSTKEFLSTLTTDELYTIQKANSLANQIQVNMLSNEGAENLFLKPLGNDKVVDLNDDGIVEIGEGKFGFFPPPNAPDSVKAAWKDATQNMSPEDKFNLTLKFLAEQLTRNITKNPDGSFSRRKPGDPGWVNIFGDTEASYISLFNKIIHEIDNPLAAPDGEQKKKDELTKKALSDMINIIQKG